MDEITLNRILKKTGLPVVYHHWEHPPQLPYLVYIFDNSANFEADNKVYEKISNYRIELYSDYKDIKLEKKIEDVLDEHDIYYEKIETFIDKEEIYQVVYSI